MKKIIPLILALALAHECFADTVWVEQPVNPGALQPVGNITLCELVVFLGVGGAVISGGLYVYCQVKRRTELPYMCICPARLLLWRNDGNLEGSNWVCIQTNDIPKVCNTNMYTVFQLGPIPGTNAGFYKVTCEHIPTNNLAHK